jgi:hypothetical protein
MAKVWRISKSTQGEKSRLDSALKDGACAAFLVKNLLTFGADSSILDDEGTTPLQEAEQTGKEDVAAVLKAAMAARAKTAEEGKKLTLGN